MKLTFFTVAALAAVAIAAPVANVERACTEYCSPAVGCVCVDLPADCEATYIVDSGDTCTGIAEKFGNFTVTQLYLWNPDMQQTCLALRAYAPICINTPDYTFTPPVQAAYGTHYTTDQTPVPLMPGTIAGCEEYELIAPGKREDQLASENGVTLNQIEAWNGNATLLQAGTWACIKA